MKHFTIQLVDSGRQTRQWSIWANALTVGSDPRNKLVLPSPAPRQVGAFRSDAAIELPFGRLLVTEDTPFQSHLWEKARDRIAKSRLLGWNEPGEKGRNARAAVLAGLGALFFFAMGAMIIDGGHARPVEVGELPTYIVDLVPPEKPMDPAPKPVEPQEADNPSQAKNLDQSKDPNQNGPTETRTVAAAQQNSPAAVMKNSAMDRISTMTEGLIGEDVDPNEKNMVDAILAGLGGSNLKKNTRGGMGAGEGDRMAAVGGYGLGTGLGNGFGKDPRATGDKIRLGTQPGTGVVMRRTVLAPKPTDLVLGEDLGSRSPESILRVIRTHIGGFRYSYDKALKENPDIGGKISVRFTIAPSGDVVAIEIVSSSTGVEALDAEIKEKARRMKFDSIEKGNVTVTYAFVLDRQ
ncbi:MAG: AgmX/PglI C-terminal domain-containing protein [Fibrobacterota bacterium]